MSSVRLSNSGCTWIVGKARDLLRYLRALPTIRVHPELDGRTLDIVHCLIIIPLIIILETAGNLSGIYSRKPSQKETSKQSKHNSYDNKPLSVLITTLTK